MKNTSLAARKKVLQALVNKCVRIKYADENGMVKCYTCQAVKHWKDIDAGHFQGGAKNYCRYDTRNIRPQCYSCNREKHSNGAIFAVRLAEELGFKVIKELTTYRDVQYLGFQIEALIQQERLKLRELAAEKGFEL